MRKESSLITRHMAFSCVCVCVSQSVYWPEVSAIFTLLFPLWANNEASHIAHTDETVLTLFPPQNLRQEKIFFCPSFSYMSGFVFLVLFFVCVSFIYVCLHVGIPVRKFICGSCSPAE